MRLLALIAALAAVPAVLAAQPAPNPNASANPAVRSEGDTGGTLAKGQNSFTSGEAKARMQRAGYSDVSHLALDADGIWRATATRNGASYMVAMDYKGTVVAQ